MTADLASPQLYTVAEAAARLGVSERWLERRVADRSIPFRRLSPRVTRFSTADLEEIIARSAT